MDVLSDLMLKLSPADWLALILLLCAIPVVLSQQTTLRAFGSLLLGVSIGMIGADVNSATSRFTMGFDMLDDGIFSPMPAFGMVWFPWSVRAYSQAWVPLSRLWESRRPEFIRAGVIIWRFVVTFTSAGYLIQIFELQGMVAIAVATILGCACCAVQACGIPWPAMYIGFVFSQMVEENLRRALLLARGDPTEFLAKPIPLTVIAILAAAFAIRAWRVRKDSL